MNTNAFWNISYGIYVVSSWDGLHPTGCIANSVMQITSSPATIAISISHDNFTNQCIKKLGKFGITILPETISPSIITTFGYQSGKTVNKFDSVLYELQDGLPIVKDGCAYITCEVIDEMETDTHTVFLGKVIDADVLSSEIPMTYSYYHNVIKGKSPKNAPSYIAEDKKEDVIKLGKYVCNVCGYVYDGEIPFDELPDSYTCPICGAPKSAFEKKI